MKPQTLDSCRALRGHRGPNWPVDATEDANEASRDDLGGFVEHVDSGRRESFRNSGEVLAFFEAHRSHNTQEVER